MHNTEGAAQPWCWCPLQQFHVLDRFNKCTNVTSKAYNIIFYKKKTRAKTTTITTATLKNKHKLKFCSFHGYKLS